MKQVVMAVRDSAVGSYMRPFCAPSVPAAVRSFTDEVNRSGSEMGTHPEDYELYQVSEYDDESGTFGGFVQPVLIVRAKDVVRTVDNVVTMRDRHVS